MRSYEDLEVWQKAHRLALRVYEITGRFPRHERFVLVPQMRRAGNSIPGNITEGCGLRTAPQLANHLDHASGSCSELHYWFRLSHELGYLPAASYKDLRGSAETVQRQLYAFMRYLR